MRDVQIETARLLLRRCAMSDVKDLVALHADPEFARFIPLPEVFDQERAAKRVQADEREWALGNRSLTIVLRSTGCFLGRGTLHEQREIGETALGYVLQPDARGNGYATEAASAFLSWGFENLPLSLVTTVIAPDNAPSIRVAKRLGMTVLREDIQFGKPVVVRSVSLADFECRDTHQ